MVGIDSTYSEIGECTKCRMMQNTEPCETLLTTHSLVKSSEMPSPMSLLTCPPFSLTYKDVPSQGHELLNQGCLSCSFDSLSINY